MPQNSFERKASWWTRKRIIWTIVLLGFVPFPTNHVPRWKITAIDGEGKPVAGVAMNLSCADYRLDFHPCSQMIAKYTDRNGEVEFPRVDIWAGLWYRVVKMSFNFVTNFLSAGHTGFDAYARVYSSNSTERLEYENGKPLPDKLLVNQNLSELPK